MSVLDSTLKISEQESIFENARRDGFSEEQSKRISESLMKIRSRGLLV